MAVAYDPKVLGSHADALYKHAGRIVVQSIILWLVVGAVGFVVWGPWVVAAFVPALRATATGYSVTGALLGSVVGNFLGEGRASALRLQAQVALCQVQIEFNTRMR